VAKVKAGQRRRAKKKIDDYKIRVKCVIFSFSGLETNNQHQNIMAQSIACGQQSLGK